MEIFIPESEVRFEFMRSSGPGGQNVNKVETKVRLFWAFVGTHVLTEEQQEMVKAKLADRINKDDELYVTVDDTRSQEQNRQLAVDRMRELVSEALKKDVVRKTKMPKGVKRKIKRKSIEEGRKMKEKKAMRKKFRDW